MEIKYNLPHYDAFCCEKWFRTIQYTELFAVLLTITISIERHERTFLCSFFSMNLLPYHLNIALLSAIDIYSVHHIMLARFLELKCLILIAIVMATYFMWCNEHKYQYLGLKWNSDSVLHDHVQCSTCVTCRLTCVLVNCVLMLIKVFFFFVIAKLQLPVAVGCASLFSVLLVNPELWKVMQIASLTKSLLKK